MLQPTERTTEQLPDYRGSPDFFVKPIGLFEIWRSEIQKKAQHHSLTLTNTNNPQIDSLTFTNPY